MPKKNKPGQGRKKGSVKPENQRRIKCCMFRLPCWLIDWLMAQPGSAGRIVEEAMMEKYKLEDQGEKG